MPGCRTEAAERDMTVLTVNTGSSSVRFAVFGAEDGALYPLASRHAQPGAGPAHAVLRDFLADAGNGTVGAVAHRVVHGGERLVRPCAIDADVEAEIERLIPLAPLHNAPALEWIRATRAVLGPGIPQVAVFDTAFYASLPEVARRYAVPRRLAAKHGLKRYGFHGLAHEAMWRRWHALHPEKNEGGRVISLQLGAGCSITAVRDGRAVDTSMGFSPLEGLVMATRAGDVDPGLLLHLQRAEGMAPERLERLLNEESGLLGLSGASADMRALLEADDKDARLAVEVYCHRARKYIGAFLAVLRGAEAILFGGGVGEHAPEVRAKILADLEWAGIVLDAERNRAAVGRETSIGAPLGKTEIWVIPVDEAAILAREAVAVLAATRPARRSDHERDRNAS